MKIKKLCNSQRSNNIFELIVTIRHINGLWTMADSEELTRNCMRAGKLCINADIYNNQSKLCFLLLKITISTALIIFSISNYFLFLFFFNKLFYWLILCFIYFITVECAAHFDFFFWNILIIIKYLFYWLKLACAHNDQFKILRNRIFKISTRSIFVQLHRYI